MDAVVTYGVRDLGDGRLIEFCDECGFDGRISQPFSEIGKVLQELRGTEDDELIAQRPASETWSAQEYLAHCLDMVGEALVVIREGRPEPRVQVSDLLDAERKMIELLEELAGTSLERPIELGAKFPITPRWMLVHLQHDLEHHLLDIRRGYAKLILETADPGPS